MAEKVVALLQELNRSEGQTIVLVTHCAAGRWWWCCARRWRRGGGPDRLRLSGDLGRPGGRRRRRVWAFVMVLACSRHLFVRPVLRMDQRA